MNKYEYFSGGSYWMSPATGTFVPHTRWQIAIDRVKAARDQVFKRIRNAVESAAYWWHTSPRRRGR